MRRNTQPSSKLSLLDSERDETMKKFGFLLFLLLFLFLFLSHSLSSLLSLSYPVFSSSHRMSPLKRSMKRARFVHDAPCVVMNDSLTREKLYNLLDK